MRCRLLLLLIAIMLPAGPACRQWVGAPGEEGFDSARAKEVLAAALDAWAGRKVQLLARADPPIRFVDEDYRAGFRLDSFRLEDPDAPIRPYQGTLVRLKLRDGGGRPVERLASYQVTLEPMAAVLRAE